MFNYDSQINQQYGQANLSDQILKALNDAGKDVVDLTCTDLSIFDDFI